MNIIRKPMGWAFWVQWTLASSLGWVLGPLVILALVFLLGFGRLLTYNGNFGWYIFFAVLSASLTLGIAQWLVLRQYLQYMGYWAVHNVISMFYGSFLVDISQDSLFSSVSLQGWLLRWALSGLLFGVFCGFIQWVRWARNIVRQTWWLWVTAIEWMVVFILGWLVAQGIGGYIGLAAGFAAAGILQSGISGMMLAWLFRHADPARFVQFTTTKRGTRLEKAEIGWVIGAVLFGIGCLGAIYGTRPCGWLDRVFDHSGCTSIYPPSVRTISLPFINLLTDKMTVSSDGKWLAVSYSNFYGQRPGEVYQLDNGKRAFTLDKTLEFYSLEFSHDGKYLASASKDGFVRLWQVPEGKLLWKVAVNSGQTGKVLAFSPDGTQLAVAGNEIELWNISDGLLLRTIGEGTDRIISLSFAPDGKTLTAGFVDDTPRLWQASDGTLLNTIKSQFGNGMTVTYLANGKAIAMEIQDGTVYLWQIEDGSVWQTVSVDPYADDIALSADGTWLAVDAPYWEHTVQVYQVSTGELFKTFETGRNASQLVFSRDGNFLTFRSFEDVSIWSLK